MSAPRRIQLRRTKGWRKPAGAVVVARPSKWGNRFRLSDLEDVMEPCPATRKRLAREWAVAHFRAFLITPAGQRIADAARRELRGYDLACWCPLDQPCHADVLLELANQ